MIPFSNVTLGLSPFGGFDPLKKNIDPVTISTGAALGSAGIGAVGDILGGLFSNSGNSSWNKEQFYGQLRHAEQMYALQYRHAMEAEQRADKRWYDQADYQQELQRAMMDYAFKNYESPAAQAKFLRAAGLNPSAMLSGGSSPFGNVGVSSAPSPGMMQGSMPSALGVSPVGGAGMVNPFGNTITGVADIVKSLAEAQKASSESEYTDTNTEFLLHTFGARVQQELARAGTMQLEQDRQEWLLSLDKLNLPKKQKWEIKALVNQSFKLQSEGRYYDALELATDVNTRLANMDLAIKAPYAANAVSFGKAALEDMKADIQQKKATAYELTQQGNEVKLRNQFTEFLNQCYGMSEDDFAKYKEKYGEACRGIIQRAYDSGVIDRSAAEQANNMLNRAMAYKNLPEWLKNVKSTTEWTIEQAAPIVGAATSIYGAKTIAKGMQRKPQEQIVDTYEYVPLGGSLGNGVRKTGTKHTHYK